MAHSNSSLNTFTACQAKYKHSYILHTPPEKTSVHLEFGSMAHNVLYQAGIMRDEHKIKQDTDYIVCIPDENDFNELKAEFDIPNWKAYFMPVIRELCKIETNLGNDLYEETGEPYSISRETKFTFNKEDTEYYTGCYNGELTGIIDLLIISGDHAIIIDYKFSSQRKTQDDFDMNSQLPFYAFFVHYTYGIPLRNIQYGYIDIPKQSFALPTILSNGTLSKSKSQNVSQEMYEKTVIAVHGENNPVYNCKPGGYYYEAWCNFAHNKPAYLSMQYLDEDAYTNIVDDLIKTAKMIDLMVTNNLPFLRRYDAYSCKGCEYLHTCKPWLTVGDKNANSECD